MIKFIKNLENFWSSDLESYQYARQVPYNSMKNGLHWHENFKTGVLWQSVESELPSFYQSFKLGLDVDIETSVVSWICIQPGQFIAPHHDTFYQLLKQNHLASIDQCLRYLIFLEDWEFGQIVDFESIVIKQWRKGDTWAFNHTEKHWACNSSNKKFHTCQVNSINIKEKL